MKRLFSLLLCLCMMLPLLALMPIEIGAATSTAKLSVEKTAFAYGEPIMVTPLVGGKGTWIGIAPKGKVSSGSMRWMNIETTDGSGAAKGAGVGVAVDIRQGQVAGNRYTQADIGPGEWTIFWCSASAAAGYDQASAIDITVVDGPISTDKVVYKVGDPILVTAERAGEDARTWYGIVPDKGGKPLYSYGTMIYYNLYSQLKEGETSNTQDIRAHSAEGFGTMGRADLRASCAAYLGCTERTMFCLPAGTYWLIYCSDSPTVDGGKAVTHKIQIRIESVLSTNKTSYAYGEPILVTAIGEGADWFFIAPKHEDPSKHNWSILWTYVCADKGTGGNKGAGSGVAKDIRQATHSSNFPDLGDIPPGEYSIFMVFDPNTGAPNADHGTRVDITVMGDVPDAPTDIQYTLNDKTTGSAGGRVTVSIDPSEVDDIYNKPSHVILYWGDANGNKLEDYTYISLYKITGETVEIRFGDVVAIPEEAETLLACTYNAVGVSADLVSVALPQDRTKVPDKGDLLTSFQIVSDVHAQETQTHKYNQRIAQMLADIKAMDPNSAGIFIAGDSVNDGWVEEYENLYALWEESGLDAPLFMASGNHEWKIGDANNSYTSDYDREKDRFVSYVNKFLTAGGYEDDVITDGKPYYDVWVNGYHYIFLASEAAITHAYLSDAQLDWLREKLAESRDVNRPSFILIHQQLYNVVDGAMPIQDWDGVIAGDANYAAYKATGVWKAGGLYEGPFREILAEFPEAMVFSGHSHWDMTDRNNIYDPANPTDVNDNPKDGSGNLLYPDTLPNYLFNTGSVAYLVSGVQDEAGKSYSNWDDSKGYYVRIYENCIEICGREFSSSQWVPNAMYRIALTSEEEECTHADNAACATLCKDCGAALNATTQHIYDNACDESCNACGATRVTAHSYEFVCDKFCNVCGFERDTTCAGEYLCSDICRWCNEAMEPKAAHVGEFVCSENCKWCSAAVEGADHTYANACDTDCNLCGATREVGAHVGEYACSEHCKHCGASITPAKRHEGEYACSNTCKHCGEEVVTPSAQHTYDNACDESCNACGATREVGAHIGEFACSEHCKHCGAAIEGADHTYINACDADCDLCGATREVGAHVGEFACSEHCKHCGAAVEGADHTYANACDTDCNLCGATREVGAHVGEFACSEHCKHCGAAIEGADHTYANACDTDCNLCGATREVGAHVGEFACSEHCKHCGAAIEGEEHIYTNACDTTCFRCGSAVEPQSAHTGEYACSTDCKFCGINLPEVSDHAWNDGAVTKEPDVGEKGEKTYTCTTCGATKTEELDALPATPNTGDSGNANEGNTNEGNTNEDNTNGSNAAGNGSDADAAAGEGLPIGAVIGIGVGAVVLLGIGGFCLYRFVFRQKK